MGCISSNQCGMTTSELFLVVRHKMLCARHPSISVREHLFGELGVLLPRPMKTAVRRVLWGEASRKNACTILLAGMENGLYATAPILDHTVAQVSKESDIPNPDKPEPYRLDLQNLCLI